MPIVLYEKCVKYLIRISILFVFLMHTEHGVSLA